MIYRIQSSSNQKVKTLLKQKDKYFFFEGEKLVRDILKQEKNVAILIVNEKKENNFVLPEKIIINELWFVSEKILERISSLKEKPDFIAVLQLQKQTIDFSRESVILGFDNIQDPANAGSVFRCAAAFGISALAFSGTSINFNNSKFLRAAQNAFFDIKHQHFENVNTLIQEAKKTKVNIYLTSSHHTTPYLHPHQIEFPCLILFGNEGKGLDKTLLDHYPSLKIPQTSKVESLNVGISACIIMSEIYKKKVDSSFTC